MSAEPYKEDADRPDTPRWKYGVMAGLACGCAAATSFGLNAPLFALKLDDQGVAEAIVGLLVTVSGVAALTATPLVPWLMGRFAVKAILGASLAMLALTFLIYPIANDAVSLTALRFVFAATTTLLYVASEAWFLELTPVRFRGRLLGAYATVFAGGFGIGGLVIAWFGHTGFAPALAAATIMAVAGLFLLIPAPSATKPEGAAAKPSALWSRFLVAPAIFIAPFAMGAIETAAFNLFPLWTRRVGFPDEAAGYLIFAAALGNVVLQAPIGLLAEKIGRERVLVGVSLIGIIGPYFMAIATSPMQVYAAAFVWSGCVTAFYVLGLIGLAQRFPAKELAAGNAAFASAYGVGQLVSPAMAGGAMGVIGPSGLMWFMAAVAVVPLVALLLEMAAQRRKQRPSG